MTLGGPEEPSWDERFLQYLARQSWEAANDPATHRNPSFWTQVKSPYYWLAVAAFGGSFVIWLVAGHGWPRAIAALLYVFSLLAGALSRRDARATTFRDED